MSAIETIRAKLQSYPQLQYEHTASSITVSPESSDGFPVSFYQEGVRFVVGFAGWHEHFDSEAEALNWPMSTSLIEDSLPNPPMALAFGLTAVPFVRIVAGEPSRGFIYSYLHFRFQRCQTGQMSDTSIFSQQCSA